MSQRAFADAKFISKDISVFDVKARSNSSQPTSQWRLRFDFGSSQYDHLNHIWTLLKSICDLILSVFADFNTPKKEAGPGPPFWKDYFMHSGTASGKTSREERKRLEEIARIKGKLLVEKLTLTWIDEQYGLPTGTAGNTLYEPHLAGERAIAAALGTRPHLLWRSRYRADGRRHSPQPMANYRQGRRSAVVYSENQRAVA
jgi:Ner family transcriptional regulator